MSFSSRKLLLVVLMGLLLAACRSEPEVDVAATVAAALSATQTAVPTATAVPPTDTPIPTDTPTPVPTETAVPTDTPAPTGTPEPTSTPLPETSMIETELESGDILYELPQSGFSLTLPPEWVVLDLQADNFADLVGAVGEQNESLSFLSTDYTRALIASGMKFYALNTAPESLKSGNPASINVLIEELPFELTAGQYASITAGQLEELFDLQGPIEETSFTIDGKEGIRLAYTAQFANALGIPLDVITTQYVMIHEGSTYVISIGVLAELAEQYLEPARTAVETFHFLD